jgi:hypothetical protein
MTAKTSFPEFLDYFPLLELPVTLGEHEHHDFSQTNEPLPDALIERFLSPMEEAIDEFTEFVPCFRFPGTHGFHALVYWKAALMNYYYVLATFTPQGELVDRQIIAGTFSDGKTLMHSMATIDEAWEILILSGSGSALTNEYDASSSKARKLELLPDGKIDRA